VAGLLEPIVGPGRARVNITARINNDSQEETEERWDPSPVVRSRQSVTQTGTSTSVQGIAGARANLPADESGKPSTPPPVPTTTPGPNGSQTAETTNYEVGKLTRHRIQPQGQIARLSVAVVLDDDREAPAAGATGEGARKTRAPEEIQKIHDLVAAAVGLDTERGDRLTVESMPFEEMVVEDAPTLTMWQQYQAPALEIGRVLGAVIVFAIVLLGFVRPIVKSSLTSAPALPSKTAVVGQGLPRTVQDLESHIDAQLQAEADQAQPRRLPALTRRVATLTQREPENAARLLRTWLTEDER
jgi:flagellar M-ring protein FliF